MLPVAEGSKIPVNLRFQRVDHPVHRNRTLCCDAAASCVMKAERSILLEPSIVRAVVAFDCHNDHLCIGMIHVFLHAPAFPIGGIRIKKDIMSVKHIQNRIISFPVPVIGIRKINIKIPLFLPGQLGNLDLMSVYHNLFLLTALFYHFTLLL